jgi:hypothetical protein
MNALDAVNGIAERAEGFVWRHTDESGNTAETGVDDPRVIVNLSVWEGVAPLENFVWNTVHRQFYRRRAEWFTLMESMHFAMWWVIPGTRPTLDEALARLAHLDRHGNTDHAFGWSHLPEATLWRRDQCDRVAAE